MNLQYYLSHRRRFEILAVCGLLLLIIVMNATTLGIEHMRDGQGPGWMEAWATESTSVIAGGLLIPFLLKLLRRLNLSLRNLRRRILWLLPIFLGYSLIHVALFVAFRKLLWALVDSVYSFDPILLGLVYEMRKDLMAFLAIIAIYYSYNFIITRLQGEAQFLDQAEGQSQEHYRSQFLVKMLDREYLVRVEDIDWIKSASNYVLLNCGERHYPMRQTLKSLSEQLDPARFQRVHRTAIVNLARVQSLPDKSDASLELQTGENVPVSKTYLPQLRDALTQSDLVASNF